MQLTFKIHYFTQWGQQIAISGDIPALGNGQLDRALLLSYTDAGYWEGVINLEEFPAVLNYRYLLIDSVNGGIEEEWGSLRTISLSTELKQVWVRDFWRSHDAIQNTFYSAAFQKAIFPASQFVTPVLNKKDVKDVILRFQMEAPQVPSGMQLGVIGDIEELGNWNQDEPLLLGNEQHPLWVGEVRLPKFRAGKVSYKYCFVNPANAETICVEGGTNRVLSVDTFFDKDLVVVNDLGFSNPDGLWKAAGLAIPVFALRTKRSFGVGSFSDLHAMVDWAAACGMRMVQILPVNDTSGTHTWTDSYPYAAISVFALHPLYLDIDALDPPNKRSINAQRKKLNALPEVHYEKVMQAKLEIAKAAFELQKDSFLKDPLFKQFFKENKNWLEPYALFCHLRDQFSTPDFSQWETFAKYKKSFLKTYTAPGAKTYESIAFHYFLQYHLDKQLRAAADYARSKGLVLKGDIPIGIYRHSADAWVAPKLYNMEGQAGAPPDPFSEDGQNWGFPTYRWDVMAKDNYQWWKNRMQQLSRYFDAYRIDHILGFFRIWEIPYQQIDGLLGVFNPAIPINISTFAERNITFNLERFCQPHLPKGILDKVFAEHATLVKYHFFKAQKNGDFVFKNELNNQRSIREYFLGHKVLAPLQETLEKPLFDLVSNVLMIPDNKDPKSKFHPRIKMMETRSFQALDPVLQARLKDLYNEYFYQNQEEFWKQQAMEKLPALRSATDMLICGEDLGMVPASVPGVMRDLNILTLEIQRMSKNPATEFLQEADIPYLSVASPSTHDMTPIRAWWEEGSWEEIQRFYEQELKMIGDHPFYCEPYIAQAIINQHLNWPSMWTVFPVQDLLAMDGRLRRKDPLEERINIPANPKHYWRYRLHIDLEDLVKETGFNNMVRSMLKTTKRSD